MEPHNHPLIEGYGPGFEPPDLIGDMAAYDALPVEVRRALDEAPFAISTKATLARLNDEGVEYVLAEIAEDCVAYHLSCEAETGVPAPRKPLGVGRKRCRR